MELFRTQEAICRFLSLVLSKGDLEFVWPVTLDYESVFIR